jgi:histidinol phosphatase-like enzyme
LLKKTGTRLKDGIFEICLAAQKACMKIVLVANQAGIGKGLCNMSDFHALKSLLLDCFSERYIAIFGVYFSTVSSNK